MDKPLFSICIPTYKRAEIVRELLKSILEQQVDSSLFEICITDNSDTDETKELISKEFSDIANLHYKKVDCKGFLNSVEALKYGQGSYLKLHNDYSIFLPNTLNNMIEAVREVEKKGEYIYFSMGSLPFSEKQKSFDTFNEFMYNLSYWGTWSSSFGIWKKDLDRILEEGIEPNYMYPHTSFLHRLTNQKKYLIDNTEYAKSSVPTKKGGYNLIDNFVRIYLTMVHQDLLDKGFIEERTYQRIEDDILKFCAGWYYIVKNDPSRYTFSFEKAEEIIMNRCGSGGIRKYREYKLIAHMKNVVKSIIGKNQTEP